MTLLIIPMPGHADGPCRDKCLHPDCWNLRHIVEEKCRICLKSIGYATAYHKFFMYGSWVYYHASCLGQELEQRR